MIEKYIVFVCCGADKRSALRSSNESWDFVMLLFRLLFDFLHMQTTEKQNLFEPAEKNCVSLEAWALFVNIVVSEIEQKTILQFKTLKINLFLLNCCPDMKKSLPQIMLTKHIIPLNACVS